MAVRDCDGARWMTKWSTFLPLQAQFLVCCRTPLYCIVRNSLGRGGRKKGGENQFGNGVEKTRPGLVENEGTMTRCG